jgi:hypothetical protein
MKRIASRELGRKCGWSCAGQATTFPNRADGAVRGKGGDGGDAICVGLGVLLGYLPTDTTLTLTR